MGDDHGLNDFDSRRRQEQPTEEEHRRERRGHRPVGRSDPKRQQHESEKEKPSPVLGEVAGELDVERVNVCSRHA